MAFTPKYSDEDFLKAFHKEKYRTASFVAKRVGCKLDTAKVALKRLVDAGEVEEVEVDDGSMVIYRLVSDDVKGILKRISLLESEARRVSEINKKIDELEKLYEEGESNLEEGKRRIEETIKKFSEEERNFGEVKHRIKEEIKISDVFEL